MVGHSDPFQPAGENDVSVHHAAAIVRKCQEVRGVPIPPQSFQQLPKAFIEGGVLAPHMSDQPAPENTVQSYSREFLLQANAVVNFGSYLDLSKTQGRDVLSFAREQVGVQARMQLTGNSQLFQKMKTGRLDILTYEADDREPQYDQQLKGAQILLSMGPIAYPPDFSGSDDWFMTVQANTDAYREQANELFAKFLANLSGRIEDNLKVIMQGGLPDVQTVYLAHQQLIVVGLSITRALLDYRINGYPMRGAQDPSHKMKPYLETLREWTA